jgi:translation initiation factor 1A
MTKNTGKGGKGKRKGKNNGEVVKRELLLKEDGQEYAQVIKILGNCRVEAFCFDGKTRLAHIRGKFKRKVWISRDDIILVGLRDFEDGKCDVIHRYDSDEARRLRLNGYIPNNTIIGGDVQDEEDIVDFDNDVVSEESDEEDTTLDLL